MDDVFSYVEGGTNTFMPDTKDVQFQESRFKSYWWCYETSSRALTAIGSSTVNSYRRLWDQGFWAPVYADWGIKIELVD